MIAEEPSLYVLLLLPSSLLFFPSVIPARRGSGLKWSPLGRVVSSSKRELMLPLPSSPLARQCLLYRVSSIITVVRALHYPSAALYFFRYLSLSPFLFMIILFAFSSLDGLRFTARAPWPLAAVRSQSRPIYIGARREERRASRKRIMFHIGIEQERKEASFEAIAVAFLFLMPFAFS